MDDQLLWLVVIISALIVGLDANNIGAGKHRLGGMADTSAIVWAIGTLLLWIIVLPLYLITRPKILAAWKAEQASGTAGPQKRCAVCDQPYPAEYDRCPACARVQA